VDPRAGQGGRKGFEAESRRERWSPEPGHLAGGALGDDGGQARPRLAASGPERPKGRSRKGGRHDCGRPFVTRSGRTSAETDRAARAEEGEHRRELDTL